VHSTKRFSVGELAELGGVSRRTVRYYVQEGLIPAPLGLALVVARQVLRLIPAAFVVFLLAATSAFIVILSLR